MWGDDSSCVKDRVGSGFVGRKYVLVEPMGSVGGGFFRDLNNIYVMLAASRMMKRLARTMVAV